MRTIMALMVITLGLTSVPHEAGAQDRRSHWGVTTGFTPNWTVPSNFKILWDADAVDYEGSEFRVGFVRGSELGGDWGVSFVRKPVKDGSVIDKTSSFEGTRQGAIHVAEDVLLTGVEVHKFSPFVTIRNRVQVGLDYGGGVVVFDGTMETTAFMVDFIQQPDGSVVPVQGASTVSETDAADLFRAIPFSFGRLELAVAVIAAPGLKVKVKGGLNFPGTQTFSLSVNYLFSAR